MIGAAVTTIGGLFNKGGENGGGLFGEGGFFSKARRMERKAGRQARRAGRKAQRAFGSITGGGGKAPGSELIGKATEWLKLYWPYLAGAVVLYLVARELGLFKKKKVVRRRRKSSGYSKTRTRSRTTTRKPVKKSGSKKRAQTVITTKKGKVIRGAANVAAYKQRIRNLNKARKARK